MDVFNAYIIAYGFTYFVASFHKNFNPIHPKVSTFLTRILLFLAGIFHLIAAFYNFPLIIVPLAFIQSSSCVFHWREDIKWNGKLSSSQYVGMALFDLLDATFLLSKLVM
jgi:hypothetical protein